MKLEWEVQVLVFGGVVKRNPFKVALGAITDVCGMVWDSVFDQIYSVDLVGMGILSRHKRSRRKAHRPPDGGWIHFS